MLLDAKQHIDKLYKKHHTLNPYELADAMGIIIHRMYLGKTRGLCYCTRQIKQIFLSNELTDWIERFVLAHELGHLIIHPNYNAPFLQSTFFSTDKYEIEANKFAVELIIPDVELMEHWEYSIDEFAMFYGLPREIMELRLEN